VPMHLEIEDRAIRDVVALQEDLGLQAATDGEFRRTSWHMDFIYQLGGITSTDEKLQVAFKNNEGTTSFTSAALKVNDRVRLDKTIFGDAFEFLKSTVATSVPKLTIPSRAWCTTAEERPPLIPRSIRRGRVLERLERCLRGGDPPFGELAVPISNSTTLRSPISTILHNAR